MSPIAAVIPVQAGTGPRALPPVALDPGLCRDDGGVMEGSALPPVIERWFASRGWALRRHQAEMLEAARAGDHALLIAPTGAGKTLAGFLPTLAELVENPAEGLHTIYVSPLKALAVDVRRNLLTPIEEMGIDIQVETRTSRAGRSPVLLTVSSSSTCAASSVAPARIGRRPTSIQGRPLSSSAATTGCSTKPAAGAASTGT